jgi:hypothetical protein
VCVKRQRALTSQGRKARSSTSGIHCVRSQSMSFIAPRLRHGSRHRSTTTESDLAFLFWGVGVWGRRRGLGLEAALVWEVVNCSNNKS